MHVAKKQFGQNFLKDKGIVQKIIKAAEIVPGETVLEIGPGTGILTEALVAAGARVIAVEADRDLIAPLRAQFGDSIELVEGDVISLHHSITQSLNDSSTPYKLVANIPYNITSKILETFLASKTPPTRMVLMVQLEVADRIAAAPPDMSLLSVVCQAYADVKKVFNVSRTAFKPSPNVDSAVVRLDLHVSPPHGEEGSGVVVAGNRVDPEKIIRLAKIGFSSRRKQLHRNLTGSNIATSAAVKEALTQIGLPPEARAETLSVHNWIQLVGML
ncbi:MAG: 16S rRNA (adenine(1518)-N(6)/adenine(1519)-N(6))-dimethyltransferase RsmA [Candidatus Uhrbacteria bacterium]